MMAKSPTNRPQTITELQTRIFQVIESIQSNESIDTTLNNNSLKTLNSFLHKIDRLSLIKNWNLNETETMSNTGVNLLTKFCKITGIVILILGFLSFICIVTGIKIDKRIAAIFQKQKNNITNSLPIQKIAYTSKNALTKLPPNYNSSKIAVKKDKAKTSDSAKSTLTIEEFTKLYNELFFTDPELSHLNSFNSIENRLTRTNKILANEKLNQYNDIVEAKMQEYLCKKDIPEELITSIEGLELVDNNSPEKIFFDNEDYKSLKDTIKLELSELEYQVLESFLGGENYSSIALKLGISEKSVDNSLSRVRKKLK
jgi:hypothetical protein